MSESWPETIFQLTQSLPWIITLALSAFSIGRDRDGKWGTELSMTLYIKWTWIMWVFLIILQSNYQIVRSHPYNPNVTNWAYPADVAYWAFSLFTYILSYVAFWQIKLPSFYWTVLLVFAFGPCAVLVWFQYNTWSEVLTSALIGAGLTIPFMVWLRWGLEPDIITLMLTQKPWTWMAAIDTHLRPIEKFEL